MLFIFFFFWTNENRFGSKTEELNAANSLNNSSNNSNNNKAVDRVQRARTDRHLGLKRLRIHQAVHHGRQSSSSNNSSSSSNNHHFNCSSSNNNNSNTNRSRCNGIVVLHRHCHSILHTRRRHR
jgi:hypothetical protein